MKEASLNGLQAMIPLMWQSEKGQTVKDKDQISVSQTPGVWEGVDDCRAWGNSSGVVCSCCTVLSPAWLLATPWTVVC